VRAQAREAAHDVTAADEQEKSAALVAVLMLTHR
jgi:hypothetical protein